MSDATQAPQQGAEKLARATSMQQCAGASSFTAPPISPDTTDNANVAASLPPGMTLRDPKHRKPVPQRPAPAAGQASPPAARPNLMIRVYPHKTHIDIGRRSIATPGMNVPPRDPSWWDSADRASTRGKKFPREAKPQVPAATCPANVPSTSENATTEEPALITPRTPMISLEEARARKDIRLRGFDTPVPPTPINDGVSRCGVKKLARDFRDFFR